MKQTLTFSLLLYFLLLTNTNNLHAQADICGIRLIPDNRVASFAFGEQVKIEFDYEVTEAGGARIFARPFSGGSLAAGYAASGSPLYSGNGTDDGTFTINSTEQIVDEIRIRVTNADQSTILREMWIPVEFHFGESGVNNFSYSHDPKVASLLLGEQFEITFDYNANHAGGNRIFIRPFTDGALTPGYGASGSPSFSGTGTHTVNFAINSGKNVQVDSLRVTVLNDDQSTQLDEFFIPVNLYFSTVKIFNVVAEGDPFAPNGENRTIKYEYETTESAGTRIFPRPWTLDGLTPGYGACGSGVNTGSGMISCNFNIGSGNKMVDHIRFLSVSPDQSEVYLEMLVPVTYFYGEINIKNLVFCPQSPVRLENGERVNFSFEVENNTGADIRVFPRPFTNGALSPGYGASGSPLYGAGASPANHFFTINGGDAIVDHIRFKVTNGDQSMDLGEFFIPVDITFGGMTTNLEEELVVEELKLYPNPFHQNLQIDFSPKVSGEVRLSISDLQGRTLGEIARRTMFAGQEERIQLNAQDMGMSPGLYLITFEGEDFRFARKVVVN